MRRLLRLIPLLPLAAPAAEPVLSPQNRDLPGLTPVCCLAYENPAAQRVEVNGEWSRWGTPLPLARENGRWAIDLAARRLPEGRHEFKFIVDGEYEAGGNRFLFINERGLIERRPDWILTARVEAPRRAEVVLKRPPPPGATLSARLEPGPALARLEMPPVASDAPLRGYSLSGSSVTFLYDPAAYGRSPAAGDTVSVAGNFNGWNARHPDWALRDEDGDGRWELSKSLENVRATWTGKTRLLFKFVVNGDRWQEPPRGAPNATGEEGDGAVNLHLDPAAGEAGHRLVLHAAADFDLARPSTVVLEGLGPRPVRQTLSPGEWLDRFHSRQPMGVALRDDPPATTYRTWSPRATRVWLNLFDGPDPRAAPRERYPLGRDPDGAWSITLLGRDAGRYYHFNIEGPSGDAEGFDGQAVVGDWYARAAAQAHRNNRVVDPAATNRWFTGWTDQDFRPAAPEDALIYETHIRHFTAHPSAGVPADLRGTFEGFRAGRRGLDHLKSLGVTHVQLMPVAEFSNGDGRHDWGYTTCFYFAPEASYGRAPLEGSAYHEFKRLVDDLHREGFGVILDVVYNHVGDPNVFHFMDKKAFFRMNPDFTLSNYSGCGNDTRSEHPMFRRMIVDNVLYWMREFHVDGFRFDLAELIDLDTLREVEREARRANPRVLLISEPWSFRGNHKHALTGTGWAAWNDDFRETAKRYSLGSGDRDRLLRVLAGSTALWTAHPLQAVNYLESHDDMALMDELSLRPDHNGAVLTAENAAVSRLAATLLFTSLGIPMLTEGQEFLRSKDGVRNTYNRGDALNAVRFTDADRPHARESLAYLRALAAFRRSPEGRALRVRDAPAGYLEAVPHADTRQAAWFINTRGQKPGPGLLVLVNPTSAPARFEVAWPPGRWARIGDGVTLDPARRDRVVAPDADRRAALDLEPYGTAIWLAVP